MPKAEAKNIEARKSLGKTYVDLKAKSETGDEATQAEAKELLEALDRFAKSELAKIEANKTDNPPEVIPGYKIFAKNWKDSEYGTWAEDSAKQLEKDDAFKKELQAFAFFQKVEESLTEYVQTQSDKKKEKILNSSILPNYMILKAKFGDTQVFQNLQSLIDGAGLKF